eukprot:2677254-Ditylum_brightwellii.AAC.1
MEKTCDGGMTYPYITHISHEVGFQFLELTPPPPQQAFDIAEAVNSCVKEILEQCVGYLSLPHNLVPTEGGIEPANQSYKE